MPCENTRAAITGGNSGIGLAIARAFRDEGGQVAILGRDQGTLEAVAAELGPETVAVSGDVARLDDLDRFFAEIEAAFGGLDVLVVAAGLYQPASLADTTPELFDRTSDVNFRGSFFTVQRALPLLRDGASVILITSTINEAGVPGLTAYAATKAALRSLVRGFAAELHPRGIRVNAISPGIIDTPIFDRLDRTDEEVRSLKEGLRSQVPVGRLGTAGEVAAAAVFLASDRASYITGVELPVSGGLGQL
ncbi:MAG: SDR family oxidoreductase [Candidatus Palauibacterales bacterium]|nr:SDR family oxidoreductase [Candidatus Palauibacterales bacterium]MDP2482792.1 SDR family oxidoreductase [Candidatus Palauibacterales bacterium]